MRWYIPYGNPTYFIWLALAIIPLMIGLLYGPVSYTHLTLPTTPYV